ncbi:hypothetical protein GUJ93_ZPchr0008g12758 [Zizania palustris]|uniref:Uncharacterized protein n=1 Tax=Zizania palustris TaxID=103762 RepID=A0A8J5RCG0_ZIZPA|nr:hypothetical protein GUJ93_ZPchr0008g12758 [Zizania palustris]
MRSFSATLIHRLVERLAMITGSVASPTRGGNGAHGLGEDGMEEREYMEWVCLAIFVFILILWLCLEVRVSIGMNAMPTHS